MRQPFTQRPKLTGQLRAVIHWDDPSPDALFYRYLAAGDEIKNLSKLVIGPGQGAILVYEGKVDAVIDTPGAYDVRTDNHPFSTTLRAVLQRFESAHKTGVWFYRTAESVDCRWGTVSPVAYVDPVYQFPVALSAFGNYSVRVREPGAFFERIVAGEASYSVRDLREVILSRIGQPMKDHLATAKHAYAEIDSQLNEIAAACRAATEAVFAELGFTLTDFRIEGTAFDADTLGRIGRIADMTAERLAAQEVGLSYAEVQKTEALRDAARNEGGLAGAGAQAGVGLGLGQALAGAAMPAAPSGGDADVTAKLRQLKALRDEDLIDEDEFKTKKAELLAQL